MGKIYEKTETMWSCDICGSDEKSQSHCPPEGWSKIILSYQNDSSDDNIDWGMYWKGFCCKKCLNPDDKKHFSITTDYHAKSFLGRLFHKLKPTWGK